MTSDPHTTNEDPVLGRDPFADMARLLSGFCVKTVVDGGAYVGSIARELSEAFPSATVYAFEPQVESFRELVAASASNGRIRPMPYALGEATRTGRLKVGVLPYTSSLLGRPTGGRRYYPEGATLNHEVEIGVVSLDDWVQKHDLPGVDVIKLDVQGYELQVLLGASQVLKSSVELVYAEVSFVPLYENTCLFHDVSSYLYGLGFTLYGLYDLHFAADGQLVYADATFISERVRARALD
jgi:FkbM family methyltransferase